MFMGSYTHSLDPAGRFVMPKSFRLQLGERFYIAKGMGCLNVLSEDQMHKFADKLMSGGDIIESVYGGNSALLQHHFFSGLTEAKTDNQNRVLITPELKAYANIDSDVVVCGHGSYIEIWSKENLADYEKNVMTIDALMRAGASLFSKKEEVSDGGISSTGSA